MDFHSLTRKELQTLCKKNKIPANIANVAMADALQALETVEGLDEIINQSQSPEKTMKKSSEEIPSTVTRTSTQRKTTKEEPQSTQPTTRIRRMTRRTVELDEENKDVNVPDTPVTATTTTRRRAQKTEPQVEEHKKSDLLETPALQSGRRKAAVKSTRRKVEAQKEEVSVQRSYGTRRSVRLLEKCMTGLSLKEGGRMEPVKIDEMVEEVVEEKNGRSAATLEIPLARNLSVSLEDENDLKDDDLENTKCHLKEENDCTVTSDDGSKKSDNVDSLSALDIKDASPKKETHESDACLAKSETKMADMPEGTIYLGADDVAISEDSTEIDSSKAEEEWVAFENNGGSHANKTKSIEALVVEAFEDIPEEALDHASSAEVMDPKAEEELVAFENNGESHANETKSIEALVVEAFEDIPEEALDHASSAEVVDPIEAAIGEEYGNHALQEIESQKSAGTECDINVVMQGNQACDDPAKHAEAEECDEGNVSQNVSDLHKDFMDFSKEEAENLANIVDASGDLDIDDNSSSIADAEEEEVASIMNEEALIDVEVAEAEANPAPQSVAGIISVEKILDCGDAEALVDICVKPAKEFSETTLETPRQGKSPIPAKLMSPFPSDSLVSKSEITSFKPLSPPVTAQFSQPNRFTPRKSSSKKQATVQKVAHVSDNNKENIYNNSEKEVEPKLAKAKTSKNLIDEETMQNLDDFSLRYLRKLTKKFDKLQIDENMKNKEENYDTKEQGKTRPALQILPQNCMHAGEIEKEN